MNSNQRCCPQRKSNGVKQWRLYENPRSNELGARYPCGEFRDCAKRTRNRATRIARCGRSKRRRKFQCLLAADAHRRSREVVAESDGPELGQLPSVVDPCAVQATIRPQPCGCCEDQAIARGCRPHGGIRKNTESRSSGPRIGRRKTVQHAPRADAGQARADQAGSCGASLESPQAARRDGCGHSRVRTALGSARAFPSVAASGRESACGLEPAGGARNGGSAGELAELFLFKRSELSLSIALVPN